MSTYLTFLLSPFFVVLIFRGIIPLHYLADKYDSIGHHPAYFQSVFFSLIIIATCLVSFWLISKFHNRLPPKSTLTIKRSTPRPPSGILWIAALGTLTLYALTGENSPIFASGGSDASMHSYMDPDAKSTAFAGDVLTLTLLLFLTPYASLGQANVPSRFVFTCCILLAAYAGKKTALLSFFGQFLLLVFANGNEQRKIIVFCLMGIVLAALFFIIQYQRTAVHYGLDYSLYELVPATSSMIYASSTSLYEQMYSSDGTTLAHTYSESLGDFPALSYWLNSFTKFFFGFGIDKSIGPFLSYEIYGNNNPNGVNPTLPFEFYFVFGSVNFGWLGLLASLGISAFALHSLKFTLASARSQEHASSSLGLAGIWFSFALLFDSLYAVRMIPSLVLLLLLNILFKTNTKTTPGTSNLRFFHHDSAGKS